MDDDFGMSEEEKIALMQAAGYGSPLPEEKPSIHLFLEKVVKSSDTTKLGNLQKEEIGIAKIPLRTYREIANFCERVADKPGMAEYFRKKGEILPATSLSNEGFMMRLAATTRREIANVTKRRSINKGWFGQRKEVVEGGD